MTCERCGRLACCLSVHGTALCRRCLITSISDRLLHWLRRASPNPGDELVLACRGDPQSHAALRLLYEVERRYGARICVLEVGEQPTLRKTSGALGVTYTFMQASCGTYTDFRLALSRHLDRCRGSLTVLPDTLEDLVAYALSEVFLGNLKGLALDASYRVAYVLGAVSLRELLQAFPGELTGTPELYERSPAREIVDWMLLSSPTLCYSTVHALLEVARALKLEKNIKPPLH